MLRFLDNKKLWWFAGEDPYILSQCSKGIRRKFSFIGILVILISLISAAGIAFGVEQILNSTMADIIIGLYFAMFVFILYLFVLYTLSRNVLPNDGSDRIGTIISYSIRIGFLILLGILVAQPLNYLIFKKSIDNELIAFKNQEVSEYNHKLNIKYAEELGKARPYLKSKSLVLKEIEKNNRLKNREIRALLENQKERNYFIRKILIQNTLFHLVNTNNQLDINILLVLLSWLVTIFLVLIFITPVLLKIFISISSEYYQIKRRVQTKVIDLHYKAFRKKYNQLLLDKYPEANLSLTTLYVDPPYNTIRKSKPELLGQDAFIKWLCNESN
ncbi:DUF4407 domain-containing protein [Zobellia amurskyensis]|uniref:DUF4407 domain-containing protein n=1 Tax=Zobellia amurskyensis TaxID=248905 RepID=A0A7X2ZXR1_9FLAO|nr:DUF4407 domain-containing protein [Zobellia amurskyensis]MUH38327.1 DUF4407 domain-containing protein [Zobellia amurskyensis]